MRPYNILYSGPSREQWARIRRKAQLVTASVVPNIIPGYARIGPGGTPYNTPEDEWEKLTGRAKPFNGNAHTEAGEFFEGPNMKYFSYLTGVPTRHLPYTILQSTQAPWLGASPDGFYCFTPWGNYTTRLHQIITGLPDNLPSGLGLVEMKNQEKTQLGAWKGDTPPPYYWAQVQCQLYVMGLRYGLLISKLGAATLKGYYIERDSAFHEYMVDTAKEFYNKVQADAWEETA